MVPTPVHGGEPHSEGVHGLVSHLIQNCIQFFIFHGMVPRKKPVLYVYFIFILVYMDKHLLLTPTYVRVYVCPAFTPIQDEYNNCTADFPGKICNPTMIEMIAKYEVCACTVLYEPNCITVWYRCFHEVQIRFSMLVHIYSILTIHFIMCV